MSTTIDPDKGLCSLLLFLATSAEEEGLATAARERGLPFERQKHPKLQEEYHWLGQIGYEPGVIAIRPVRQGGRVVMGSIGRLGTAARGIRFREATGAQAIIQLGMAFGVDPRAQALGDVLVSTELIPYDNRDVRPAPEGRSGCVTDYAQVRREPARPALVNLFLREQRRGGHAFGVHLGALLSGAARIHCADYRNELVRLVPTGENAIVGGEMEGVGLLAASVAGDDPIWCVVKGISDFADEDRDTVIGSSRAPACRNAADFVLAALANDARARDEQDRRPTDDEAE